MFTDYAKNAFQILQEEGPVELFNTSIRFVLQQLDPRYHRRFKFHTWKNHLRNRIKYDAPPDPYQPIFITPKQIEYKIRPRQFKENKETYDGLGLVNKDDWDSKEYAKPVDKHPSIYYFTERFVEGKNQEETRGYKQHLKKRRSDKKHRDWGFETAEEYVSKYFDGYDELYKKISEDGYRKNDKNPRVGPKRNYANVRDRLEVLVLIDREGHIHLWDGHHRFGIARVLDLEIPSHVLCRHKQWQECRDEIHNNGLSEGREELRDHPDLQDILD